MEYIITDVRNTAITAIAEDEEKEEEVEVEVSPSKHEVVAWDEAAWNTFPGKWFGKSTGTVPNVRNRSMQNVS